MLLSYVKSRYIPGASLDHALPLKGTIHIDTVVFDTTMKPLECDAGALP
jgi:hypothetical protein